MNLQELFKIQAQLDERIKREHSLQCEDTLDKKILALRVEMSELANELPEAFKFWSNKKNNYEKALVEYIDCLHFILSIGIELNIQDVDVGDHYNIERTTIASQLNNVFDNIVDIKICVESKLSDTLLRYQYAWLIKNFRILGDMLEFTWKQVSDAYMDKNKINHERQEAGY